ncbi:MAG: hypothetical protein ACAH80_09625 [Alphaproteobacteria bacterium]
MKAAAPKPTATKYGWIIAAACLAVLGLSPVARAQLGDVGIASGAAGMMNNNPIAQGAQQTQAAAALAAGQPAAAVAPGTPPAAAAPAGAPAAAAPAGAPVAAAAPATAAAAMSVPAPEAPAVTDLKSPFVQSLFFSPQDIIAIKKASETRGPIDTTGGVQTQTPVIPMNRYIAVSGISYKSPDNWVVWINGRKVVKGGEGVLKELVEIKPQKDYVDLLWFDIGLNGTIKIKMRPNQTYYIVPGLLLPGVAHE